MWLRCGFYTNGHTVQYCLCKARAGRLCPLKPLSVQYNKLRMHWRALQRMHLACIYSTALYDCCSLNCNIMMYVTVYQCTTHASTDGSFATYGYDCMAVNRMLLTVDIGFLLYSTWPKEMTCVRRGRTVKEIDHR